jgi:biopolymer transport protein TolQ
MQQIMLASLFSGSLWEIIGQTSAFGAFILVALLFMSLTSWVVILNKWRQFRGVERDDERFLHEFRKARRIGDAVDHIKQYPQSPLASIYAAGVQELVTLVNRKGPGPEGSSAVLDSNDFDVLEMTMEKTMTDEVGKLERLVVFLATTSSAAPFMGLLGTVVGIMDSFWSIGERGNASLAIVAPGIAEALLATIVGLAAAIPAVMAFNWATNKTKFLHDHCSSFILEFLARSKKELF